MRILIVAQYYTPDITAAAFRIAETAELLAARGHEVVVVTAEPHRVQAKAPAPAKEEGRRNPRVHRVRIEPLQGSGLKAYLRHYFSFVLRARRAGRAFIREGFNPDVIWVSSPPLFVGLVGPALRCAGKGARFFLDIRDLWPDTAVAAGQISREGKAYRIGRLLERRLYRRADGMSCVASPMAEYLREATGGSKPVAVVYNGVAAATVPTAPEAPPTPRGESAAGRPSAVAEEPPAATDDPSAATEEPPAANRDHPAPTVGEILYAGNWGRLQGLDTLLRAWSQVANEPFYREWKVRLIGSGVMEGELRELLKELEISDRVVMEEPISKGEALRRMEGAGVLFLNLRPDPVFSYTIPSKLFDYLRAGRPIVGGIPGEGETILRESGGNVTFPPSNTEALVEALHRVAEGYAELEARAPDNRRLVLERFTREAATSSLEQLLLSRRA